MRILGPEPALKGGIVSFVIDGFIALDVAMMLEEQGVAVRLGYHCAMPLHAKPGVPASLRARFYLYNTLDEIDRFGETLDAALRMLRPKGAKRPANA